MYVLIYLWLLISLKDVSFFITMRCIIYFIEVRGHEGCDLRTVNKKIWKKRRGTSGAFHVTSSFYRACDDFRFIFRNEYDTPRGILIMLMESS